MVLLAVKENRASNIQKAGSAVCSEEAVAFCPRCKAVQTVWLSGKTLLTTRKFKQTGSGIYHECGSIQPCRLYYSG
jgi:hypothetical protein